MTARLGALAAGLVIAISTLGVTPVHAQQPFDGSTITAGGAVLWDPQDEVVLWSREPGTSRMMASTTKIMTVLLALEAGTVEDTVTVSAHAARMGGASLGLREGQRIPMRSLLAGLVLRSGNDAAVAVAEHVAGSEDAFVTRMNQRASELGLDATRFLNASGLTDDTAHRASPLDLARLTKVAMANTDFRRWAGSRQLTVTGLAPMVNRNELFGRFAGTTGVKTGFTERARYALVASAAREGWELYAVVLGSEDNFGDAAALLAHGFGAFRRVGILDTEAPATRYRWSQTVIDVVAAEPLGATLGRDEQATWRTVLRPEVVLPVRQGDQVGTAELLVAGAVRRRVPLVAGGDVTAPPPPAGRGEAAGAALIGVLRSFARTLSVERSAD